ncbi:MAG: GNAT family N-acetyltransferase [Anaeromyxobacteraceae bacterium]
MRRDLLRTGQGLRIEEHREGGRLDALGDAWRRLFADAGEPVPFLSWEWLSTFRRRLAPRAATWTLEAWDGDRLAGALALVARPALGGGRRWQLLGNGLAGADRLDVLARPDVAAEVRAAFAGILARGAWDALDLEDLPCGSPTVGALRAAFLGAGARVDVERGFTCPGFAVQGTWEAHARRIGRRETFGRRVRWLARQPGFAIEVAAPDEVPAAFEDFLRLHRLRWSAEGGSAGIPDGPVADFHREVVGHLAARGWLRLYRLRVGDAAVAAVYGVECGRRFFYYQSGYDPAWSARSPGMVLVGRTVEDAYARGLVDYDFLRGTEAYKLDWASDRRETVSIRARARSARGGVAWAVERAAGPARAAARAVAPAGLWAALSRARRRVEARAVARQAASAEAGAGGGDGGIG